MKEIINELEKENVGKVVGKEPLSKHTTWKIGGPADIFIEPDGIDGLVKTMEIINKNNLPWRAIGRGSNLLVDDDGVEGAVIKLGQNISHLEIEGETLRVGGGYSFIKLATIISKEGLSGLEFAGGIPGTVGGAVFMNAGAHGSDMSNILIEARVLFPDGRLEWVNNEDMNFSYRTSRLQKEKGICVEAKLQMKQGDKKSIVEEMQGHKSYRRETQPWNYPCAGSVFRNPLPDHAGALIEKAGLKGYQVGGAQISELHGNFIVNVNEAKAADVLAIIKHVQDTIRDRYQVDMNTEVELVKRQA
ncbi:UDP-N-acetylmuramate dehydrogenase [Alteribacillus bidgolensis]|uniref:UDP-N-acetylenolpyruvoylglucosamine reductase n=1 Tax=Alteribacillus bidgolensis TaxID=930129 RepID=A0A1G8G9H3_9BACI|nr:UDP-N-acetylmuramate dehydrogenase [Alteribacillus bidgolensis]SDH91045.1 UDP-N-acetylmuramate dehydrogenase [Alteribacillus bidgolensis]